MIKEAEKLTIPNPEALDMGEMFGIPLERRNEIAAELDAMVKNTTGMVHASDIFRHIESMCETREEFVWALANHILWMARRGRWPQTPQQLQEYIITYGEPMPLNKQ